MASDEPRDDPLVPLLPLTPFAASLAAGCADVEDVDINDPDAIGEPEEPKQSRWTASAMYSRPSLHNNSQYTRRTDMMRARIYCIGFTMTALFTLGGCTYDIAESAEPLQEESTAESSEALGMICPAGSNCGLTWVKESHDNTKGQDKVSCHDGSVPGSNSCNPYTGDTDCKLSRPILCIRKDGSTSNGFVGSFYNGWAAGNIGITHPIPGTSLTSLNVANGYCVTEFGVGWQMAEHHDGGGGWAWTAYGNLNDIYTASSPSHNLANRFWVYVDGQAQGNCW